MSPADELLTMISRRHQLLLVAALSQSGRAHRAWREWCEEVVFDDIDAPEQRILPILAQRPEVVHGTDPLHGRIRGLHRKAWVSNEQLIASTVAFRNELSSAGIPYLHVEALPISGAIHDRGTRPLYDIDICLPRRSMKGAQEILDVLGWSREPRGLRASWQHRPMHFVCDRSRIRLICDAPWPGADRSAWSRASTSATGESLLGIHDQLVHAAIRSTQKWQRPPAYWVADVVRLSSALGATRTSDALDDAGFVERAIAHRSLDQVATALTAADDLIGALQG